MVLPFVLLRKVTAGARFLERDRLQLTLIFCRPWRILSIMRPSLTSVDKNISQGRASCLLTNLRDLLQDHFRMFSVPSSALRDFPSPTFSPNTTFKPLSTTPIVVLPKTTMPETLTLRLIEVYITEKGFRTKHLHVVTTLLDTKIDSSESLADLYRRRWNVELDLNAIKTMMGLDQLRGRTPHMMRLELFVGLLAYNLVRLLMMNSVGVTGGVPRGIGFTAALGVVASSWMSVFGMGAAMNREHVIDNVRELGRHRSGHRSGRVEPRVLKRRLKAYPRMQESRATLRKKLLAPQKAK